MIQYTDLQTGRMTFTRGRPIGVLTQGSPVPHRVLLVSLPKGKLRIPVDCLEDKSVIEGILTA